MPTKKEATTWPSDNRGSTDSIGGLQQSICGTQI